MSLNLDSLQSTHGLDTAITEGKAYKLEGNDAYTFLVRIPSQYNKPYSNEMAKALSMAYSEDGEVKMTGSMYDFREAQQKAFLSHCLVSINGEPVPEDFLESFPKVVDELMAMAQADASVVDGVVDDAVKK